MSKEEDRQMAAETAALVADVRNGSESAFAMLASRYRRMVESIAYSKCLDADMALDVAQEVFAKAWRLVSRIRDDTAFGPWLAALTRTTTIDQLRRRREKPAGSLRDAPGAGGTGADSPAEAVLGGERRRLVREAVTRLPPAFREIVTLRYFRDLSYREIAEALGEPVGTVQVRLFRARQRLKEMLKENDG
jgi:RNA polymerase sigma-70 factor (ECF subfamily)